MTEIKTTTHVDVDGHTHITVATPPQISRLEKKRRDAAAAQAASFTPVLHHAEGSIKEPAHPPTGSSK